MEPVEGFEVWAVNWGVLELPDCPPVRGTIPTRLDNIGKEDFPALVSFTPADGAKRPVLIRGTDVFRTEVEAWEKVIRTLDLRAESLYENYVKHSNKILEQRIRARGSLIDSWRRANPGASHWKTINMILFGFN